MAHRLFAPAPGADVATGEREANPSVRLHHPEDDRVDREMSLQGVALPMALGVKALDLGGGEPGRGFQFQGRCVNIHLPASLSLSVRGGRPRGPRGPLFYVHSAWGSLPAGALRLHLSALLALDLDHPLSLHKSRYTVNC